MSRASLVSRETAMPRELQVHAQRSLLARPQRWGFLPTIWFWNDWRAQRLILPFVLMVTPLLLVINALQMWLRFDAWISIALNLVVPFLTMGLVERSGALAGAAAFRGARRAVPARRA